MSAVRTWFAEMTVVDTITLPLNTIAAVGRSSATQATTATSARSMVVDSASWLLMSEGWRYSRPATRKRHPGPRPKVVVEA
jgi:hypothetical protein